jgi:hypothetical protein
MRVTTSAESAAPGAPSISQSTSASIGDTLESYQ